jgi:hypothetical protein
MQMDTERLIDELIALTKKNMDEVQSFKILPNEKLNLKTSTESWSILECIEHLNRYGDFYIPEIKKQIENSNAKRSSTFKSGLLGNYFAESMLPKEELNKMRTFKAMNPNNSSLDRSVLNKFTRHQELILELLEKAKNTDLTKIKTSISISKWIRLRLGDTFRIVIYHNVRHIVQAKKTLKYPQATV